MVAYVQQWLQKIIYQLDFLEFEELHSRFAVLADEINRLDPRDFPARHRFEFLELRMKVQRINAVTQADSSYWSKTPMMNQAAHAKLMELGRMAKAADKTKPESETALKGWHAEMHEITMRLFHMDEDKRKCHQTCRELDAVLGTYGGQGSAINTKAFPFVSDPKLREIVERDYRSLIVELIPAGAWKSAVIMAGSILEAILYDQLTKDAAIRTAAMASPRAPKKKKGTVTEVKDITSNDREDEWALFNFIEVSVGLGILPQARADAIDQVLRDYRNFVHPRVELRNGHPCTEAEADLAKGALGAVINHLSP